VGSNPTLSAKKTNAPHGAFCFSDGDDWVDPARSNEFVFSEFGQTETQLRSQPLRRATIIIGHDETATRGNMITLSDRVSQAVDYARLAHATQVRKGSNIPYLYHLLGVASLVIEFGGNEDQVIAGLLHDTVEDCGAGQEAAIRTQFGDAVTNIVMDCTDGAAEGKASHTDPEAKRRDWVKRKLAYLAHLKRAPDAALLVSACDKLHNARAIVQGLDDPEVATAYSTASPVAATARSATTRRWRRPSWHAGSRSPGCSTARWT
jgi:(p)ppGpp synthase/HD superfamily hydrolase